LLSVAPERAAELLAVVGERFPAAQVMGEVTARGACPLEVV
jgi:hypothetical protein